MIALAALILVAGALSWLLLDHYLRLRRARPLQPYTDTPPESPASEDRMTLSQQQLRTMAINHVRRVVASGKHTPEMIARWKKELGDELVQKLLDEAKGPSAPASREQKKAAMAAPTAKE